MGALAPRQPLCPSGTSGGEGRPGPPRGGAGALRDGTGEPPGRLLRPQGHGARVLASLGREEEAIAAFERAAYLADDAADAARARAGLARLKAALEREGRTEQARGAGRRWRGWGRGRGARLVLTAEGA